MSYPTTAYVVYSACRQSFSMAPSTLLVPVADDTTDPLDADLASGENANVWTAELVGAINLREDV